MTGMLKDLMHARADEIDRPVLDLDAITREGARRVRRRRGAGGALAVAAAVAVGIAGPQLVDLDGTDPTDDTNFATSESPALTWAEGSVIHSGGKTVDVGHEVHAFVTTPAGYVFTDTKGTVWSWAGSKAERIGEVGEGGAEGGRMLTSDGASIAWLQGAGAQAELVLHDTTTGTTRSLQLRGGFEGQVGDQIGANIPAELFAVSGTTAYFFDGAATRTADFSTPGAPVSKVLAPGRVEVADVEGDLLLATFVDAAGDAGGSEVTVATRDLADRSRPLGVRGGDLSPAGTYVMSENSDRESDHFTLLDVQSGKNVTPAAAQDYDFFLGYAWIDDATYTAFGLKGVTEQGDSSKATVELLVCTVATRACTVGGRPGSLGDFQIPGGQHIGG